jgi:hypothetical protein
MLDNQPLEWTGPAERSRYNESVAGAGPAIQRRSVIRHMEPRPLKAGTTILFATPAVPMPADRSAAIAEVVASAPEVVEAHLPLCFIAGQMPKPAQKLFVVFAKEISHSAMQKIGAALPDVVSRGDYLDMMPITLSDSLPETVRGTNCQIYARTATKPRWWQFWRGAV